MYGNNTTMECTMRLTPSPFVEPKASRIVRAIIMAVIILVSLAGNCALCCLIFRHRGRKPFSYILVANLAIAELIGTVCYPFLFYYESPPWSWVFGDFMCHVVNPLSVCCSIIVTFTMAAIAVYRCLVFMLPVKIGHISRVAQFTVLIFSWVWATSLALPSSVTRRVITYQACGEIILRCDEIFTSRDHMNIYTLVLFVCQHATPFIIMIIAYFIVALKVKKYVYDTRRKRNTRNATETADRPVENNPEDIQLGVKNEIGSPFIVRTISRRDSIITVREQELLKIMYTIMLIYFLCYLPYNVMFVIREFKLVNLYDWDYDYVVSLYLYLLQCLPSALHPIVILRTSRIITRALK